MAIVKVGRPEKPRKLSKHDVLAHMHQFVNYIEDFLATPKPLRKNLDMSILRNKVAQCKFLLACAEEE